MVCFPIRISVPAMTALAKKGWATWVAASMITPQTLAIFSKNSLGDLVFQQAALLASLTTPWPRPADAGALDLLKKLFSVWRKRSSSSARRPVRIVTAPVQSRNIARHAVPLVMDRVKSVRCARPFSVRWYKPQPVQTCNGRGETISSPCKTCHGSGLERKTIKKKVQIPAGVDAWDSDPFGRRGRSGRLWRARMEVCSSSWMSDRTSSSNAARTILF